MSMRRLLLGLLVLVLVPSCKRGTHDADGASPPPLAIQAQIPPPAVAPDLGRVAGAAEPSTGISLDVNGARYTFAKTCLGHGGRSGGPAAGGAIARPRRPQQVWITGCDDSNGYFHVVVNRGPTPGPAGASILLVTLPGGAQQDARSSATVRLLAVTDERISGSFEALVRPADGGTIVRAHGTFDVPRRADDTSPGP